MKEEFLLGEKELSILTEIGKRGAQNASRAISKMSGQRIDLSVSDLELMPIEDITKIVVDSTTVVTAVYLKITGDVAGSILLIFPQTSALSLAELLLNRPTGEMGHLDEQGKSAVKEASNILSGSFLTAVSDYLGLSLVESVPDLSSDLARATVDTVLIDFAKTSEQALVIHMIFSSDREKIKGYFLILFDTASAKIILEALIKKSSSIL